MKNFIFLTTTIVISISIAVKCSAASCWTERLGYSCCSPDNTDVFYVEGDGDWGIENGNWCGIQDNLILEEPSKLYRDLAISDTYTLSGNPFENHQFFINPFYTSKIDEAITSMTDSLLITKAEKMKEYSNAVWLDSMESSKNYLERILDYEIYNQIDYNIKILTVFVIYDLPGRDCHALASNGEFKANDHDYEIYKTEYIDYIADKLSTYKSQPVVLIIEPNSIASLVTNLESTPACVKSEKYYLD
eukprot:jgi/Orpsp1_1/1179576/evm.model.c7180000069936.1